MLTAIALATASLYSFKESISLYFVSKNLLPSTMPISSLLPTRTLTILRISRGKTILPNSSTLRTIPFPSMFTSKLVCVKFFLLQQNFFNQQKS